MLKDGGRVHKRATCLIDAFRHAVNDLAPLPISQLLGSGSSLQTY